MRMPRPTPNGLARASIPNAEENEAQTRQTVCPSLLSARVLSGKIIAADPNAVGFVLGAWTRK